MEGAKYWLGAGGNSTRQSRALTGVSNLKAIILRQALSKGFKVVTLQGLSLLWPAGDLEGLITSDRIAR